MRLGACEKMRLTEGGGFLGAFGRAAAKAGRARTAAAAADRFAAGSDGGGGGGGGGARFPAARVAPAMLHRRYSATENAARRLRRDVHTQGLELGEVVAERRELQARLPTMAVLILAMPTCYGYLLCRELQARLPTMAVLATAALAMAVLAMDYLLCLLTMARATGAPRLRGPPEGQGWRPGGGRGAACSDQTARDKAGMGW
eukprot:scaffold23201_cov65-Phaeocystis_antarctica.AAC.4